MNRQAAIEKNRTRLLRLVLAWLAAAVWMRRFRLTLPVRISNWVGSQLFKAEATTGLLVMLCTTYDPPGNAAFQPFLAAASRYQAGLDYEPLQKALSLDDIIARIKAIRSVLRRLSPLAKATNRVRIVGQCIGCLSPCRMRMRQADVRTLIFLPP